MAKVSTTWKKILHSDKWAFQMYNKALKLTSVSFVTLPPFCLSVISILEQLNPILNLS